MDIDSQIETIKQWTREAAAIALKRTIRASTRRRNDTFTAGTRIHRADEKKSSRQFDSGFSARDTDDAFFERLP